MEKKQLTNTGALAVGSFSLIGWLLPTIFKGVGWIEWSQDLGGVFALFADTRISWSGIYVFLFLSAVSLAVTNNWHLVTAWIAKRRAARERTWNFAVSAAINFIANSTNFGKSLNPSTKYAVASEALEASARAGHLIVAGRSTKGVLERVPLSAWATGALKIQYGDSEQGSSGAIEATFVDSLENSRVVFRNLMVDAAELDRNFH